MFRFGHFSDIHFKFSNYDTNNMRSELLSKLAEFSPLHAIFITGDIFYKGDTSPSEIKSVKQFISQMAEAANCDIGNVFICAGNHDLLRCEERQITLNAIIEKYKKNNKDLKTQGFAPLVYDQYCVPFNRICKQITGNQNPQDIHRFIPLQDINLIILNTAIFAGQTYPGQINADDSLEDTNLFICDDKFETLKAKVVESIDNQKPTIVLGHHSPDCFEGSEKKRLVKYLNSLPCDLYLCGHIHTISTKLIENTNETYQISCGGPFKDNNDYNIPSFVIGEYSPLNHQLELTLYSYKETWEIHNQSLPPWKHGHWNREIKRLQGIQNTTPLSKITQSLQAHKILLEKSNICIENLKAITPGANTLLESPDMTRIKKDLEDFKLCLLNNRHILPERLCEELEYFITIHQRQILAVETFDDTPVDGFGAKEVNKIGCCVSDALSNFYTDLEEEISNR